MTGAGVSGATSEQSESIAQIKTAVGQMDRVTQTGAANAEESAAASKELNAQASATMTSVNGLAALVGWGGAKRKGGSTLASEEPTRTPVKWSFNSVTSTAQRSKISAGVEVMTGTGAEPERLGKPSEDEFKSF